jgi:CBS-domain-containing membrane protein
MQACDAMSKDVICISPQDSLGLAKSFMDDWGIRHLPVVVGRSVVGILTDRDVLLHSYVDKRGITCPNSVKVESVIKPHTLTADAEESIGSIAATMADHKIDAIPIVDSRKNIIGLITSSDLLNLLRNHGTQTLRTLLSWSYEPPKYERICETSGFLPVE